MGLTMYEIMKSITQLNLFPVKESGEMELATTGYGQLLRQIWLSKAQNS